MARMIGIEIGSESLKMAEFNGRRIKKLAVERMPQNMVRDGRPADVNAMAAFIKEMRKAYKIRGGDCALVLPPSSVVTTHISLPPMGENEVMNTLPFEFKDYITGDPNRWLYDFVMAGTEKDEKDTVRRMNVFAAAVPAKLMDDYYTIFRKSGFRLKSAIPAEMAWMNLVRGRKDLPRELCILDLGHKHTEMFIFADGRYVIGKIIDLGGEQLDEIIAGIMNCDIPTARIHQDENTDNVLSSRPVLEAFSRTAVDVMRTVNFYNYDGEGRDLHDIYLCGGGAFVSGLRMAILKSTDMQLHSMEHILPNANASRLLLGKCSLAAGAAVQPIKPVKLKDGTLVKGREDKSAKGKKDKPAKEKKPFFTLTLKSEKKEEEPEDGIE